MRRGLRLMRMVRDHTCPFVELRTAETSNKCVGVSGHPNRLVAILSSWPRTPGLHVDVGLVRLYRVTGGARESPLRMVTTLVAVVWTEDVCSDTNVWFRRSPDIVVALVPLV